MNFKRPNGIPVRENGTDEYSECYTEKLYEFEERKARKKPARFYEYRARTCEFCKRAITARDRREAPYADGRYLCAACGSEYMDLHHSHPFFDVFTPSEVGAV